ncbi:MAG: SPOR domain-containing protein, partial [Candidatus Eiseniibacteriota bacterium]
PAPARPESVVVVRHDLGPSRKRDLAEEQRAALPPRLRAKLDDEEDEDLEDYLPRSRGRGMLIGALVLVAAVVVAIVLARFGVIPGLPFMGGALKPAPAALTPALAPVTAPVDTAARAAAADSAAKALAANSVSHGGSALAKPATSAGTAAVKPATPAETGKPAAPAETGKPAAAKPVAATSTFGISVATYLDADRAESERVKLAGSTGLQVSVREASEGGTSVYHLVLGEFDTRASAENEASDLIQRGLVEEARIVSGPRLAKR